jgi:hypothetical protein
LPATAEKPRAEQRREEQHRFQQVRDAVEAAGLRGAERRQRDRLRIEPEDEQVGAEHGATRDSEREERREQGDERDHPPPGEP